MLVPIFISSCAYNEYMKKESLMNIKYVDAHYGYDENVTETTLSPHEAYGFVKRIDDNILITFIKKSGADVGEGDIVKGLIIPDTALVSIVEGFKNDTVERIAVGSRVAVTWRDIVYVANTSRHDCSVMYTEGVLLRSAKDHIVLEDPETIRVYPAPTKNHPAEKPRYYVIPISFIKDISVIE